MAPFLHIAPVLLGVAGGVGLLGVGVAALVSPRLLARLYGLPVAEPNGLGFVRACGLRDLALGGVLLAFVASQDRRGMLVVAVACLLLSAADFLVVWTASGRRLRPEHASHLAGFVACAALIALLLAAG